MGSCVSELWLCAHSVCCACLPDLYRRQLLTKQFAPTPDIVTHVVALANVPCELWDFHSSHLIAGICCASRIKLLSSEAEKLKKMGEGIFF